MSPQAAQAKTAKKTASITTTMAMMLFECMLMVRIAGKRYCYCAAQGDTGSLSMYAYGPYICCRPPPLLAMCMMCCTLLTLYVRPRWRPFDYYPIMRSSVAYPTHYTYNAGRQIILMRASCEEVVPLATLVLGHAGLHIQFPS